MKDSLFSQYPNFEFCSSVCASAKKSAAEEQRTRESNETSAAEYQERVYEAQQRAQSSKIDELIRLQREANRIAEEESEARSLGISRKELVERNERRRQEEPARLERQRKEEQIKLKQESDRKHDLVVLEEERLAKLEGITRDEWRERKATIARKAIAENELQRKKGMRLTFIGNTAFLVVTAVLFVWVCTLLTIPFVISTNIALAIIIPLIIFMSFFLLA
jgi:hypothetical protein